MDEEGNLSSRDLPACKCEAMYNEGFLFFLACLIIPGNAGFLISGQMHRTGKS